jgi:hypothetical protein
LRFLPVYGEGHRQSADSNNLTSVVMAAVSADIVRALQFTAVGAFTEGFNRQRIVRTAIATTMRGYFSLGDSHGGTNSSTKCV